MEEDLAARAARKKRRHSSCEGEISEAPASLLRDDRGRHHFRSDKPNELWIADVAEFRIPAGKAHLPPIVDCSGGMPLSWPVSTPPDAGMAIPGSARTAAAIAAGRDGQGYAMRTAWSSRCRGRVAAPAARGAGASSED